MATNHSKKEFKYYFCVAFAIDIIFQLIKYKEVNLIGATIFGLCMAIVDYLQEE